MSDPDLFGITENVTAQLTVSQGQLRESLKTKAFRSNPHFLGSELPVLTNVYANTANDTLGTTITFWVRYSF